MKYLLAMACLFCSLPSFSQGFPSENYPRDYFRDPLDIPISLAANFGELRPNHYHMGLDIRTQKRVNLPVFAAADGYIARVAIEPAGFGQAIYIRHPNGFTTVYGHLNKFFPALAAYVAQQQYKLESWQVSLEIPPALFPVKKGDFIALSGSTGGSQGPHLHFEIRRTDGDINLNPLLFGLPLPDNAPPTILRLAYYDRDLGIYEQSPHILAVRKSSSTLLAAPSFSIVPGLLTVPFSRISFAISAFDTQTGSSNPNGIYESTLYVDDRAVIGFQMNNISYDDTRNINAHIDYKTKATGGPYLQQLSFLQGYPFPSIYRSFAGMSAVDPANTPAAGMVANAASASSVHRADGVIDLGDGRTHSIRIVVKDVYGNESVLSFKVQYKAMPRYKVTSYDTSGHPPASGDTAKKFYPGMVDGIETTDYAFFLGEKSLYDSVVITARRVDYARSGVSLPGGISDVWSVGAAWIPLMEPVLVRLTNARALKVDTIRGGEWISLTDKIVMVRTSGAEKEVKRAEWHDGMASARFREFGNFQLVDDNTAPVITPLIPLEGANLRQASRIAFMANDNLGAVRNFRAELDGHWLCFTNDKGLAYIYIFDAHCSFGAHTLKVSVEDVAGNRTIKEYHFTR